jgi:exopolysaccharide biosynthesis protein
MGGGLNPRTAIGQRADGAVLLLIIDGRQTHSLGASMNDLINEMLDFGAVNAANLDGGGSTVLYYDGAVQNKISSIYGARGIPTAILVR